MLNEGAESVTDSPKLNLSHFKTKSEIEEVPDQNCLTPIRESKILRNFSSPIPQKRPFEIWSASPLSNNELLKSPWQIFGHRKAFNDLIGKKEDHKVKIGDQSCAMRAVINKKENFQSFGNRKNILDQSLTSIGRPFSDIFKVTSVDKLNVQNRN